MGNRFRTMRATGTIGLLLLLALGVSAQAASADPLSMTFTEARANVGVQLSDEALFEAPATAPFEAQIDPGTGAITAGYLHVPQFSTHITNPIDADVDVVFDYDLITGSFNQGTGALTLSGETVATLKSTEKECNISTTPAVLTLTTAGSSGGTSPRTGTPFTHGLTGAGAIAGQWTDMHATPVDPEPGGDTFFCEDVEDQIGGPGGVWLEQAGDLVPPPAPQLISTEPAEAGASGTPKIHGLAEAGSTVRIYAGTNCTGTAVASGTAVELVSPGIQVAVAEGTTASFSATATDVAGNTSPCSGPIKYTRLQGDPPPPACIVPKLVGKKLSTAKSVLKAAGCKLGQVTKPPRHKGKHRPLIVKSSTPAAGATPADRVVDLVLKPKPRKAHR